VAQWPNPAITVFVAAVVLLWGGIVNDPQQRSLTSGIGIGALTVWALDELFRGVSPIRRMVGAAAIIGLCIYLS
jgi:multisubunit Na+/H+ antiporter MnhE subunit